MPLTQAPARPDSTAPDTPGARSSTTRIGLIAGLARHQRLDAVVVGLVAALIGGAFLWVPSIWYDEAATVVAATRDWPGLWRTVQSVDAVHMGWYAAMHLWFDLIGYSPVTLRLPSVLCIGVTSGLLVILARRFMPRRGAVAAGLLFAVLPRTTLVGTEGRTFALSALLAVALTLLLLTALDRSLQVNNSTRQRLPPATWWWAGYAALTIVSTTFFIYLALLVVAHAVTVLIVIAMRTPITRTEITAGTSFAVAAMIGAIGTAPLALMAADQSGQVGWIDPPSIKTVTQFLVTQWSPNNLGFAWLMWGLVILGVGAGCLRREHRGTLALLLPWLLVPSLTLLALSFMGDPLWAPRYQTFSAPALALVMALGTTFIPSRRGVAVLLIVAAVVSAPSWSEQRQPTAKDGAAWDQVANVVSEERISSASSLEEGIIYGPVRRHAGATSRIISYTYPEAFTGMKDFTLQTEASETGGLWEDQYEVENVLGEVDDLDVVWLVTSDRQDWRPKVTELLDERGFTLEQEWNLSRSNVLKFSR